MLSAPVRFFWLPSPVPRKREAGGEDGSPCQNAMSFYCTVVFRKTGRLFADIMPR